MMRKRIVVIALIMLMAVSIFSVLSSKGVQNMIGWWMVDSPSGFPADDWLTSTPEAEGIESSGLIQEYQYIADDEVNAHSLLIIRNGKMVDETYFYPYQKDDMINIHSCTKSILSALVGIAIDEGYIKSIDQKVLDFFTDMKIENMSSEKQSMTIRHLLTMSSGLQATHPDYDMKSSDNWVQFILDKKMAAKPGTVFNYCDSTPHLLSALLQKATGSSTYDYAKTHLFEPMGIDVVWPFDPQGVYYGFSEINMTPRDMAKFGYLYLNIGKWDGKQLVPAAWVIESTKGQIKTDQSDDYGYLWWCPPLGFQACGLGDQIIEVIPSFNSVIVCTNGLDDDQSFDFDPVHKAIKRRKLPENPDVYDALRELEQQVALMRKEEHVSPYPAIAQEVSGKHYTFPQDNPLNLKGLIVDFSKVNSVSARKIAYDGTTESLTLPTEGSYIRDVSRKSKNDTIYLTSYWQSNDTFVVVYEKSYREIIYFTFMNDQVIIHADAGGETVFDGLVGIAERG